jgi:predicted DNA-binding transcriptional regulator YafY
LRHAPLEVLQAVLDEVRELELSSMNQAAKANVEADIVFAIEHNEHNPVSLQQVTDHYNGHRTTKMSSHTLRIINE